MRPGVWKTVLRGLVTLGLCGWLVTMVEPRAVAEVFGRAHPLWAALSLAIYALGHVIYAASLRQVLFSLGRGAPLSALVSNHYQGLFFNNFLPGNMGGDVYKVAHLGKTIGSRTVATVAIVLQRLLAMLVTMAWVVVALPLFGPGSVELNGLLALGAAVPMLAAILLMTRPLPAWLGRLVERLPRGEDLLLRWRVLQPTVAGLVASPRLAVVIGWIGTYQICMIAGACAMARALDVPAPWTTFIYLVPLSVLAGALPVAINGIGVREGVYVAVLTQIGVARPQALSLALALLLVMLLASLTGGILYAKGKTHGVRGK